MKFFRHLRSADFITILFLAFLSALEIVFWKTLWSFLYYIPLNVILIGFIFFAGKKLSRQNKKNLSLSIAYDWYLIPTILFIYTQASSLSFPLHGRDYDSVLIAIDRFVFGTDPTHWLFQFAHPVITEILQAAYSSYYLFFIFLFYELYKRKMIAEFEEGSLLVVYGFYLSYLGYLLVPAVGPRFTLYDFHSLNSDLPGLWLTPFLRDIINSGGGVGSTANPLLHVHRDAFPSGHTQLTLTAIYIAFKNHTTIRWGLLFVGSLLIISTLYMRYHYAVDVFSGVIFFFITIWSGKKIHRWWILK
jgi:membrane-associated phospholipid phosphatase